MYMTVQRLRNTTTQCKFFLKNELQSEHRTLHIPHRCVKICTCTEAAQLAKFETRTMQSSYVRIHVHVVMVRTHVHVQQYMH